jgi:peptidyl-prolyl cis-trans isomerase SurA
MRTRSPFAAVAILVCAVGPGACSSKPSTTPPAASADAWAVVDGREIKKDTVEKAYRRAADPNARLSDAEQTTAKLGLLNELITQDLLMAKAKALGIDVTAAEIESAYNERRGNVSTEEFQKQLTQRGLTPDDLKDEVRRDLTTQKLFEHEVTSQIAITDQAVTDYFSANRAQFNLTEPAYRLAQIVITPMRDQQITNRQNDDATTPEAAARKVKMIADKLHAGAQFSELAMDYSEDPQSAPRGGDLGLIPASQLQQVSPALRDAVLKAQPGTISQVAAGGGYTLVLLAGKEPAGQRDLSTPGVRENITSLLRDRQQQLRQEAFLTVLRNDAQVLNVLAKQVMDQGAKPPATIAPAAPGKKQP